MPTSDYFAATYAEARSRFLAAAESANARLNAYTLPGVRGPNDEELVVDVAALGPDNPRAMLVLISGTHGVEGLCGSGCQVGYFADRLYGALPAGTGSLLIHALNPYGLAWLRRVNEENVDLSRNFHDFTQPLPPSAAYEELHAWLVPEDWDGPARLAADAALQSLAARRGAEALQAAVSSGQYTRPSGLFYGGTKACWSNITFGRILESAIPNTVKRVASLDLHSGLGPPGYGEPMYVGASADAFERAKKWYGPEVTDITAGTSTSAPITGSLAAAVPKLLPGREVTHITLEYGTVPIWQVFTALRADHWLHAVPSRTTAQRDAIKRQIRDAFYVDEPAWKAAIYGRTADFIWRAGRGLGTS